MTVCGYPAHPPQSIVSVPPTNPMAEKTLSGAQRKQDLAGTSDLFPQDVRVGPSTPERLLRRWLGAALDDSPGSRRLPGRTRPAEEERRPQLRELKR